MDTPNNSDPASTATANYGQGNFIPAQQPGQQQVPVVQNTPGRQGPAIASLVLGIVAAVFCLIPFIGVISLLLAPIGLVLGIVGWRGASKGKRAGKGKAIAGVVLALVAGLLAIVMTAATVGAVNEVSKDLDRFSGDATEQVLSEDLDVQIGQYEVSEQEFGLREGALTVTLTNKSDERQNFDVKVEAMTASGDRIGVDTAFVSDLGPGQSDEVEMFAFEPEKDKKQLENARFAVVEASAY